MAAHLWFVYSLGAALCWGIGYVLAEKLLKSGLTPAFMMFFSSLVGLPLYFLLAASLGHIKPGIDVLIHNKSLIAIFSIGITTVIIGNFLILHGISAKNATLASLIEISYPLFTFLFAWLIFNQIQLTYMTAAGAALIFAGITVILFNS